MKKKGYTLIEVLVAITIFSLVIASPTGFFVSSLKGQQRALSSQELTDSMSYTLEYVSKALRMAQKDNIGDCPGLGYNYATTTNSDGTFKGIKFRNYDGICQEFFTENKKFKETKAGETNDLTPNNLEIVSFKIMGTGWGQTDDIQPKVTLFLEVIGKTKGNIDAQPRIKLQTTISQRNLDVNY